MFAELDNALAHWLPYIEQVQAAQDFPVQGLPTHTTPPTLGQESAPDRLADHPTDQSVTWAELLPDTVPAQWRMALRIDVYQSAQGTGYVVTATVLVDGAPWSRAIGYGPDSASLTHGWRQDAPVDPA